MPKFARLQQMIRRPRSRSKRALRRCEGFVHDETARHNRILNRSKQIALQVPSHQHELESLARQRMLGQIGAPASHGQPFGRGGDRRIVHGIVPVVHAERDEAFTRQQHRMTAASDGDIERAAPCRQGSRNPADPCRDERRWCDNRPLAQALLTAVCIGFAGLVTTAVFGIRGTDIARHISYGIFSTLITLLAHSMMMFYLIGKGKAVKDAMAENNVAGDYYRRIAQARKPVFSIATLAMAVTMTTAILGASVDTRVLPPIVHAMIAYGAIACNLAAVRIEVSALSTSGRIVDEVNRLIGS